MKRVLLSGYYGFDNSGDDAILKAIVDDLKQLNIDLDIVALSKNPSKTESIYGIKAVDRFSIKEVSAAMKGADLFISGGGSLLQDVTSTRSIIYYLAMIYMAMKKKLKTYVFANGIGPIDKKLNRYLTEKILNRVNYITLRDDDSKVFVDGLKVQNKNMEVTADPVFRLKDASPERIDEIFRLENIPTDRELIGISLRNWKNIDGIIENFTGFCNEYLASGSGDILLVPMHFPEDLEISMKLKEAVEDSSRVHVLKQVYVAEEIIGIISRLKMILAMRLHALIYAVKCATPIVGLVYDPKVEALLKQVHVSESVDVENFTLDELTREFHAVYDNISDNEDKLKLERERLQKLAKRNIDIVEELLEVSH